MYTFIKKIKELILNFVDNPIVSAEYIGRTMTVKYERGQIKQYEGSCTVWHKLPHMKRCGTATESWLCDLWEYNKKWKGAYPDAHKKDSNG